MMVFVTLDRIVWTLLDSLHLMTAVYPVEGRVIWAWFRHVSCVCALVQNSISVTLRNFGQDCLDILRFTTPHDSSLSGRRACQMGVVSSRELCLCISSKFYSCCSS